MNTIVISVELAKKIALNASSGVSLWTIQNKDVYPNVEIWRNMMDALDLPREEIENDIKSGAYPFAYHATWDLIKGKGKRKEEA